MATTFGTGITIQEQIIAASQPIDVQKQTLIFGTRTTNGTLIEPPVGSSYSMPDLFKPIQLPAFTDGVSAVNYLVNNYGYVVEWGVNFTTQLPAPSSVSTNKLGNGAYQLIWNTIPNNFAALTTISLTGSITQMSDTGSIVPTSVQIIGAKAYMQVIPNGSSTFDTTDPITLNGINNIQKPNPATSDQIVVGVYAYYAQATVLPQGATIPNCWISVLNDNCTTINPESTPVSLVAPTMVTVVTGGVTLTYPSSAVGLGYLPTSALGNTIVTQTTSLATGTFNGYIIDSLGNVDISVINVTGTFNTSDTISIALDVTQSAFNYLGQNQINTYVLPFQITTLDDLITTQASFYNNILELNNGYGAQQQKFVVQGYYANLLPVSQLLTLQTPNTQIFKGTWKGDQPSFLDYPETPISVAAASAYLDVNCNVPFYSQANVTLNLSASSNANTYPDTSSFGDCNTAVTLGWTPFAINANGLVYCWRNVTSLITIPSTNIQDVEFRFVSLWLKQRWLQQQVDAAWQLVSTVPAPNSGMVLNSGGVRADMKSAVQSILFTGQSLGMFQNVASYSADVTVVIDPLLPTGIDVTIPNQVIPELATANVTIQVFSVYYQFTS